MAGIRHDMEGDGEPPFELPFEPPPRPASTSILPDGRSVVVHPKPTKRRSKPESLTKVATINSARDRLSQRRGTDNLHELYEEPQPRLFRREDATVGQEPVDYKERAISVYNQFPAAANGEDDQTLIGSICNFFPVVPTGIPFSAGPSDASAAFSPRNEELVKHYSALLDKDHPAEPFLQDQIPFKDLFPNAPRHSPKHSAKSSLETSTTDGALSFMTAYDGAFDTPTSPTGEFSDSNIASSTATAGLTGTQLSPISDHTEPSTARASPIPLESEIPNQRRRRVGATISGSPRSRTLRNIGSVIGGRPSGYYLTPQPDPTRQHIVDEMKVLKGDLHRQAITFQPNMIDGATDHSPIILPTPARRLTKYNVGPSFREAHDAHEVIMGYKRSEKPSEETSNESQKLRSKTVKNGNKFGRKSASNVAINPPRVSSLDPNSVANRLSRPTATSAAREAIGKDRRRQSDNVFDNLKPPPEPKKAVHRNPVKRAGHGLKTKFSSFMGGRDKNRQYDVPPNTKNSISHFGEEVPTEVDDHRISRNITTYHNSGMNRRVSQLPRPYATTPDLTEFTTDAEVEDVLSPRPSTSHETLRADERYPSLHHTRAISPEHTLREEAHASREELGDVFRSLNAGLMDINGRFRDDSNAVAGPSSAANGLMDSNGRFHSQIKGLDAGTAGPSSAAKGPLFARTSTTNGPTFASTSTAASASVPTPPATQGGGGPAIPDDVYGNLVDEMLHQAESSLDTMIQAATAIQDPAARDSLIDVIELIGRSIANTRTIRIDILRQTEECVKLAAQVQMFAARMEAKV